MASLFMVPTIRNGNLVDKVCSPFLDFSRDVFWKFWHPLDEVNYIIFN